MNNEFTANRIFSKICCITQDHIQIKFKIKSKHHFLNLGVQIKIWSKQSEIKNLKVFYLLSRFLWRARAGPWAWFFLFALPLFTLIFYLFFFFNFFFFSILFFGIFGMGMWSIGKIKLWKKYYLLIDFSERW